MSDPPWSVGTVFFDAAGTLFRVRGAVGEIYGRYAASFGFDGVNDPRGWARIEDSFVTAFQQQLPMTFPGTVPAVTTRMERQWWRDLVERTFAPLGAFPRIGEFFDTLYEVFQTSEAWELESGCQELLSALRKRGIRLGIISNFDSRLVGLLGELGIGEYFEHVTISSRGPAAKPDRRIFQNALARLNTYPQQSIHIGDDVEQDYRGAQSAGMAALLYDPEGRAGIEFSGFRIASLAEASAFLL